MYKVGHISSGMLLTVHKHKKFIKEKENRTLSGALYLRSRSLCKDIFYHRKLYRDILFNDLIIFVYIAPK